MTFFPFQIFGTEADYYVAEACEVLLRRCRRDVGEFRPKKMVGSLTKRTPMQNLQATLRVDL